MIDIDRTKGIGYIPLGIIILIFTAGLAYSLGLKVGGTDPTYLPRTDTVQTITADANSTMLEMANGDTLNVGHGQTFVFGQSVNYWCNPKDCAGKQPSVLSLWTFWGVLTPSVLAFIYLCYWGLQPKPSTGTRS